MGWVLVLIYFQNGFPTDLVIKRGSSEFSHPLDYLGVPFRFYRSPGFGHLLNDCSLPFNKHSSFGSVHKIWRVKNSGSNLASKEGMILDDSAVDLNSHKSVDDQEVGSQSSLTTLKTLSFTTPSNDLGCNKINKNPTSDSFYDPNQNDALRDLGFVSPPKDFPVVSKGYFLRSCSKYFDGGFGPDRDTYGKHLPVKGRFGVLINDYHSVNDGAGALRAKSPKEFPL